MFFSELLLELLGHLLPHNCHLVLFTPAYHVHSQFKKNMLHLFPGFVCVWCHAFISVPEYVDRTDRCNMQEKCYKLENWVNPLIFESYMNGYMKATYIYESYVTLCYLSQLWPVSATLRSWARRRLWLNAGQKQTAAASVNLSGIQKSNGVEKKRSTSFQCCQTSLG